MKNDHGRESRDGLVDDTARLIGAAIYRPQPDMSGDIWKRLGPLRRRGCEDAAREVIARLAPPQSVEAEHGEGCLTCHGLRWLFTGRHRSGDLIREPCPNCCAPKPAPIPEQDVREELKAAIEGVMQRARERHSFGVETVQGVQNLVNAVAPIIARLRAEDRAEIERLRHELAMVNNSFGSQTADWPEAWKRVEEVKAYQREATARATAAEEALKATQAENERLRELGNHFAYRADNLHVDLTKANERIAELEAGCFLEVNPL